MAILLRQMYGKPSIFATESVNERRETNEQYHGQ